MIYDDDGMCSTNLVDTSINLEHQYNCEEIKNGKYVLSESNVGARIRQPVQQCEDVDKPGRIAAICHHN